MPTEASFYTPLPKVSEANRFDGVFEGGGTLGTAYVGALLCLARQGYWFKRVAGTSAGAITAALIAAGYNANQIDWLCAPAGMRDKAPPGVPRGVKPFNFKEFLDPPASAAEIPHRKDTLLWLMLAGNVLRELIDVHIDTPPLDSYLKQAVGAVADVVKVVLPDNWVNGAEQDLLAAVRKGFRNYPDRVTLEQIAKLLPRGRAAAASVLLDLAIDRVSFLKRTSNLFSEGGLFKGDAFLATLRKLLQARVFPNEEGRPVTFADLPVDLVVIATKLPGAGKETEMMVYSRGKTPDTEVALAVRYSMSIPHVFEPYRAGGGREFVDGGVLDNFPFWILTEHGKRYLYPSRPDSAMVEADLQRPKILLSLDEGMGVPTAYGVKELEGYTPPSITEAVFGSASGWSADVGTWVKESLRDEHKAVELTTDGDLAKVGEVKMVARSLRHFGATISGQHHWMELALRFCLEQEKYQHLWYKPVPMQGHFWLDFEPTTATFNNMAARGWATAMDLMQTHGLYAGAAPANPYNA